MKDNKERISPGEASGFLHTIGESLKIIFKACRRRDIYYFATGILASLVPSVTIWLQKKMFSNADMLQGETVNEKMLYGVIGIILAWGCLRLVAIGVSAVKNYAAQLIQGKVSNYITNNLLDKVNRISYYLLDTPEIHNKISVSSSELVSRLPNVVSGVLEMLFTIVTLVSVVAVAFTEDSLAALVIIAGIIPACIFTHLQNDEEYYNAQWSSIYLRKQNYLRYLFVTRQPIREMRTGQFTNYLQDKWEVCNTLLRDHRYKLIKKYFFFHILSSICKFGSLAIALLMIVYKLLDPASGANIGSFVLIYGIGMQLQMSAAGLYSQISSIATTGKYLDDYEYVMDIPDEDLGTDIPMDDAESSEYIIEFDNVTFSYPGTDKKVLNDVSLKIRKGEKIAIVGENGSGKSTFVYLLCGLYKLDSGEIRFMGHPINKHIKFLRENMSVVFQDFGHYEATVAENIAIGDTARLVDMSEIVAAAKKSDAHSYISTMEMGYDTYLGTLEEGRADLSGGQWQKIAFARAILRKNAKVMVLDEQTAALDPVSEAKFYKSFKDIAEDRTAIMISHRLGATKLADRIIVFSNGRIIQNGTHKELMAAGGEYAEMYEAQSQWYV